MWGSYFYKARSHCWMQVRSCVAGSYSQCCVGLNLNAGTYLTCCISIVNLALNKEFCVYLPWLELRQVYRKQDVSVQASFLEPIQSALVSAAV